MLILSIIRSGMLFIIVPILAGRCITDMICKREDGFSVITENLVAGYLFIWSLIEIIAIPITMLKASFSILVYGVSLITGGLALWGLVNIIRSCRNRKNYIKDSFRRVFESKADIIIFIIMIALFAAVLYCMEKTLFFDEDDSRFVVNAVDIVKTNRILATDPTTGLPLAANYDDFHKDLVGQWAAFLAYASIVSGVHVTIFSHMIYPVIALVILGAIYWMCFAQKSVTDKSLTLIVVMALYVFGYYSRRNSEAFALIRSWQGKATLACVGILVIIWAFMYIGREPNKPYGYIMLLMGNVSACLMTSMGIVLAAVLIGVYGVVYALLHKKIRIMLLAMAVCIPNVLLYILSEVYTLEKFLS